MSMVMNTSARGNFQARWLFEHGIGVFPIRERAKEPACKWASYEATPEKIARFSNYGVRLGVPARDGFALAVLDPDSPELVSKVMSEGFHLPETQFIVKTSRGLHLYYRIIVHDSIPKFLRRQGVSIEFRNKGQYTVGPGSVHPSGAIYTAREWSWDWNDIGFLDVATFRFDDGSCQRGSLAGAGDAFELPDEVHPPERHEMLNSLIASLVCGGNADQFFEGDGDQEGLWQYVCEMAEVYAQSVCVPPLPWDRTLMSFVQRSMQGAIRMRLSSKELHSDISQAPGADLLPR